jgi:hypothetical protein
MILLCRMFSCQDQYSSETKTMNPNEDENITSSECWLNPSCLDVLTLKTRGQRLRQFIGLLVIGHNQCVQMARASDLEFGLNIALANLHQLGIGSACLLEKVTDVGNLLGHDEYVCK